MEMGDVALPDACLYSSSASAADETRSKGAGEVVRLGVVGGLSKFIPTLPGENVVEPFQINLLSSSARLFARSIPFLLLILVLVSASLLSDPEFMLVTLC